jgi:retinal rod rhodopsin-sensitive cGMP 3',5'-cyclic phosphodiesterase subunit delta
MFNLKRLRAEFVYDFGFVIPGSTNAWEHTIEAADPEEMLPAETLSGHLVTETTFYSGEAVLGTMRVRVFYE